MVLATYKSNQINQHFVYHIARDASHSFAGSLSLPSSYLSRGSVQEISETLTFFSGNEEEKKLTNIFHHHIWCGKDVCVCALTQKILNFHWCIKCRFRFGSSPSTNPILVPLLLFLHHHFRRILLRCRYTSLWTDMCFICTRKYAIMKNLFVFMRSQTHRKKIYAPFLARKKIDRDIRFPGEKIFWHNTFTKANEPEEYLCVCQSERKYLSKYFQVGVRSG